MTHSVSCLLSSFPHGQRRSVLLVVEMCLMHTLLLLHGQYVAGSGLQMYLL